MKKNVHNKIVFCAAFKIGFEVLSYVIKKKKKVQFVITCDKDDSIYEEKIWRLCKKNKIKCLRKVNVNSNECIKLIKDEKIDLIFLAWWPTIINQKAIEAVKIGWLNMHPSLLPYGRGKHPYYWSIVHGFPFGATIHFIDENIDAGKIVFQKEIQVDITDTGESLYEKSLSSILNLFKSNIDNIFNLKFPADARVVKSGNVHFAKHINKHSNIDLERQYKAKDIINIMRARTFWKGDSSFFYYRGKKYFITADDLPEETPAVSSGFQCFKFYSFYNFFFHWKSEIVVVTF